MCNPPALSSPIDLAEKMRWMHRRNIAAIQTINVTAMFREKKGFSDLMVRSDIEARLGQGK